MNRFSEKRRISALAWGATTIAATLAVLALGYASVQAQATILHITRTSLSVDGTTLFVYGTGFGTTPPAVTLDGQALTAVAVNGTGTTITALMPAMAPGLYRLTVERPGEFTPSICTLHP